MDYFSTSFSQTELKPLMQNVCECDPARVTIFSESKQQDLFRPIIHVCFLCMSHCMRRDESGLQLSSRCGAVCA